MNRKNNTTIGLDIAKNVFHYAELNRNGKVTGSGMLKRNKVLSHFAGLESTKVWKPVQVRTTGDASFRSVVMR